MSPLRRLFLVLFALAPIAALAPAAQAQAGAPEPATTA